VVILFFLASWNGIERGIDLPSIPSTVHSRKRHAAVGDLEEGLVFQVQGAQGAAWDCLREADDSIVVDEGAAFEGCGEG
jgi:hypothetical protein